MFSFGSSIASTTYSNLAAGTYFFEVAGAPSTKIGTAFNVTIQAPSDTGPLPAIPEPANMALLLAGLGLMGFMAKRARATELGFSRRPVKPQVGKKGSGDAAFFFVPSRGGSGPDGATASAREPRLVRRPARVASSAAPVWASLPATW